MAPLAFLRLGLGTLMLQWRQLKLGQIRDGPRPLAKLRNFIGLHAVLEPGKFLLNRDQLTRPQSNCEL
jgi:hypothetical protein